MATSRIERTIAMARQPWHGTARRVLVLALAVVCMVSVAAWVTAVPAGRLVARRILRSADAAAGRLWVEVGLRVNPRVESSGWTIILPRGQAAWLDAWGRPAEPGGDLAAGAPVLGAVAQDVFARLHEVVGFGPGGAGAPADRPPVVVYDSGLMLGPWASGAQASIGLYFGGVVGIEAGAVGHEGSRGKPSAALQATLAHELSHWYIDVATYGGMPRWLSEGLAMRAEERYLEACVPVALLRERALRAGPMTVQGMAAAFGRSSRDFMGQWGAYQNSRGFVAYLDDPASRVPPGWEGRLAEALADGSDFGSAITAACSRTLADLEAGWLRWLSSRESLSGWTISAVK